MKGSWVKFVVGLVLCSGLLCYGLLLQAEATTPSGAIAYWTFDEGIGSIAGDATVNGYDGTITGASWTSDSMSNYALSFDGSGNYVSTPLNIDQGGSKAYTFEAWVYPTSISVGRHQVISPDNHGYDWSLLREGGTWHVFTGSNSWSTGESVDLNEWQHVVAVFEPGVGVKFYKNAGTPASTSTISYDSSDCNLAVGRNPCVGGGVEYFAGIIDEVVIYDRTLSASEVQDRYESFGTWLRGAMANNASGGGDDIQAGDQVVITFSYETQGNVVTVANVDSALGLSNGHSWLDGNGGIGGAVWSDSIYSNDTLTITLSVDSGEPTVRPGDTITLDGTIKDKNGEAIIDSIAIGGSFDAIPLGAVAYWRFDEGSGNIAYDTVNGYDGTITGASWTSDSMSNYALSFDGSGNYVSTPLNIDQGGSKAYTFEAWVYPTSISVGRHQVISPDNHGYDWSLLREGGTWHVFTGSNSWSTGESVDLNEWQHVVAVFEPGVGVKFYKNAGTPASTSTISYDSSDCNLAVGRNPCVGGGVEYFAGIIDEVVIYDRALTDEEVQKRYNPCDDQGVTGIISPSLDTLWPPNHDMVTVTIDASGLVTHNPDTQISITSVSVTEYSSQEASEAYGDNIYDENNFEPDVEITGDLTLNLRSERIGASTGRSYTITVTATDCSGSYTFITEVVVPHDKGN